MSGRRAFLARLAASGAGCASPAAAALSGASPCRTRSPPAPACASEEGGLHPQPGALVEDAARGLGRSAASARVAAASPRTSGAPAACARTARGSSTRSSTRAPARSRSTRSRRSPSSTSCPAPPRSRSPPPAATSTARRCQNWEIAQARPEQVPSMTLTPADGVMLREEEGRAARGLHLHRARRLLRVRARHRGRGPGGRACARSWSRTATSRSSRSPTCAG